MERTKRTKMDLRKPEHRALVNRLFWMMREEQLKITLEFLRREWNWDQDLKDIELLSLLEEGGDLG